MAALAGVLLLWLAVPRVAGDILVAPLGELFQRLERLHPDHDGRRRFTENTGKTAVTFDEVLAAIETYETALGWYESADHRLKLGRLYFVAARLIAGSTLARETLFRRAVESTAAGLAEAPANPVDWTRLAVAVFSLEGGTPHFSAVLAQAIRTAPYAPALVPLRVRLGLAAWPELAHETRDLVAGQVAVAVELLPERLIELLPGPADRRWARDLLGRRPDLLARFDRALAG